MQKLRFLPTLFLFLISPTLFAQDGELDPAFDGDGIVTTSISAIDYYSRDIVLQPDGKLLAVGISNDIFGLEGDFIIVRYNLDGGLDNSFGTGGTVSTSFTTDLERANGVVLQNDGKILVAGFARLLNGDRRFAVVRYLQDGLLDNSFDTDGMLTTAIGLDNDQASSIAVQSDGKIIVAGHSSDTPVDEDPDFSLVRYNSDGSLDNTFDSDGIVTTDFSLLIDRIQDIAIQPDGKIVAVGFSVDGAGQDLAMARYNTDGSLDNTFGTNGKLTENFGTGADWGTAVALQPDGKIIVGGWTENGTNKDFAVARFNADGSLDNSFGGNGKVETEIGTSEDVANDMVLQPDGKIILAGYSSRGADIHDFALVRYLADGSLDTTWGTDGKLLTSISNVEDHANAVLVQPDGNVVAAGYTDNGVDNEIEFAVVRYLSDFDVGIVEFGVENSSVLVYPNPIASSATLKYTLTESQQLSIQLMDMQGKVVTAFLNNASLAAGSHELLIELPQDLPAGAYQLVLSNGVGQMGVRVVKR